jgi:thiol-disulfide isomerase/thioredoxin
MVGEELMALMYFYGTECQHCNEMKPLIAKLEKEEKVMLEKLETWHNSANNKKLHEIDDGSKCGGVPFFWNDKTQKFICGSTSYEKLKKWALGK